MNDNSNKLGKFENRRIKLLFDLYKILFDEKPSKNRDTLLIEAILFDFGTDRAAIVSPIKGDRNSLEIVCAAGKWNAKSLLKKFKGIGIANLISIHDEHDGAITLSRFRRPNIFEEGSWKELWDKNLNEPTTAILSVALKSKLIMPSYLWLMINSSSVEWNSHDRKLAEEIATLLAKAAEKAVDNSLVKSVD